MSRVTIDPWNYLKNIVVSGGNAKLEKMEYPNYPDNCYSLDVTSHTNHPHSFVRFDFDHNPQYSANIFIEDRLLALKRSSPFSKFSTDGPTLSNTNFESKDYVVEIEQEIFDEKDKNINCKNYPNEKFSSYSDCDQKYMESWMEKHIPNIKPIWASRSKNETTTHATDHHIWQPWVSSLWWSYAEFVSGIHRSDCPLPCRRTKIATRSILFLSIDIFWICPFCVNLLPQ